MFEKIVRVSLIGLTLLTLITSPPVVRLMRPQDPTPPPTRSVIPTVTPTATATPDSFATVPTVTPRIERRFLHIRTLPSPTLGELPPTYTPPPVGRTEPISASRLLLPDPTLAENQTGSFPAPPPAGMPPDHLRIPRLKLAVPVRPVGMVPVPEAGAYLTAPMPRGKVAGWLATSAPWGQPGNTVLTGRHQIPDLTVFHDLWTLEPDDVVLLAAGDRVRRYLVSEVVIVPEPDQPLERRRANAVYIQPTSDERLTLVTGGPAQGNTQRTIVSALPD
jgi:sortase A